MLGPQTNTPTWPRTEHRLAGTLPLAPISSASTLHLATATGTLVCVLCVVCAVQCPSKHPPAACGPPPLLPATPRGGGGSLPLAPKTLHHPPCPAYHHATPAAVGVTSYHKYGTFATPGPAPAPVVSDLSGPVHLGPAAAPAEVGGAHPAGHHPLGRHTGHRPGM